MAFGKKTNDYYEPYSLGKLDQEKSLNNGTEMTSKESSDDETCDSDCYYEIDFWKAKKLSENVFLFKIRDTDREVVGYAIASSVFYYDILGTDFGEMKEMTDMSYLKDQLKKFCQVYYAQKN